MNFKNEPGHAQSQLHAWPLINQGGKAWKKGENTLWPGSCLRLSIIWHLRGSHQCSRILTISTVIIYEVQNSSTSLFLPRPNIEYGRECFRYSGVKIWNSIPEQIRNSESLNSFNRNISSVSLTNQLFDYNCTICFVTCILYFRTS